MNKTPICLVLLLLALVSTEYGVAHAQSSFEIRLIQERLAGYDPGEANGELGNKTRAAIIAYQKDWLLPATGEVGTELMARLTLLHPATKPHWHMVQNQDCEIWNNFPRPREAITWSGNCINGKIAGTGKAVWNFVEHGNARQSTYDGEYNSGKRNGRGIFISANGYRYEGEYRDDKKHGQGAESWEDGSRYKGAYNDGKQQGQGVYSWPDGSRYVGGYLDGKRHGQGFVTWANGGSYDGNYERGAHHGKGIEIWSNGDRYEGNYFKGRQHGHGTLIWASGDLYTGPFAQGKRHGVGNCTPAKEETFKCHWNDGKLIARTE